MTSLYLALLGLLALSTAEKVRFRSVRGQDEEGLPAVLHVELDHPHGRSLNVPASLRLTKNTKIANTKFYVDDVMTPPNFQNVAFYQDKDNGAVITVKLVEKADRKVRTLLGSFVKDGKSFEIEPEEIPNENSPEDGDVGLDGHMHNIIDKDPSKPHSLHFDYPDGQRAMEESRSTRAVDHFDVEMNWVSDPAMYRLWQKNHKTGAEGLQEFYAHLYNGMDLAYGYIADAPDQISISCWVDTISIKTSGTFNPTDGAKRVGAINPNNNRQSIDEDKVLELMETYRTSQGWTWKNPDHFMVFTGYDLTNGTIGYAPVGGICTPGRGNSAVEFTGWDTWVTAAHELGHNLGMSHDGGNGCVGAVGNIMAPSTISLMDLANIRNAFKFSSCSVKQTKKCLQGTDQYKYPRTCLKDTTCEDGLIVDTTQLKGETLTLDQQCKDAFGDKVVGACSSNFKDDICKKLWCSVGGDRCLYGTAHAVDGTPCPGNKWCIEGACVAKTVKPTSKNKPCTKGADPPIPSTCTDRSPQCTDGNLRGFPGLNCPSFKSMCCKTCREFGFQ